MIYQCWANPSRTDIIFLPFDSLGELPDDAVLVYQVQARTWTEAKKKHYKLQGWSYEFQKDSYD